MSYSYIIIDDNSESTLKTLAVTARFRELQFIASAATYQEGLNLILEHRPTFVFLEVDPKDSNSGLSFGLINELHRFLKVLPKIIITTNNSQMALQAIQYGAFDCLSKPLSGSDLIKTILKFQKSHDAVSPFPSVTPIKSFVEPLIQQPLVEQPEVQEIQVTHEVVALEAISENESVELPEEIKEDIPENEPAVELVKPIHVEPEEEVLNKPVIAEIVKEEKPLIICVKSYGDYRFIEAKDICYLQADNNSTDIHLFNGEMITAFKTLKHFENVLSSPFVRIHNSYIVNIDYVSRIHTGNSVCYIKNTTTKLPFSKSYKENVDAIISSITNGNYLEI